MLTNWNLNKNLKKEKKTLKRILWIEGDHLNFNEPDCMQILYLNAIS